MEEYVVTTTVYDYFVCWDESSEFFESRDEAVSYIKGQIDIWEDMYEGGSAEWSDDGFKCRFYDGNEDLKVVFGIERF